MKNINGEYSYLFSEYPEIVSVKQLQKMLGISRHLVYELISNKLIPAIKIGNSFKIPKINVIKYILSSMLE